MCFSLAWIEAVLIWLVILGAVIAVLQIFVPWVLSMIGFNLGPIPQIIRIVIVAIIVIAAIYFVFDLISCLGGFSFPRVR
jgi:hypothetical protein